MDTESLVKNCEEKLRQSFLCIDEVAYRNQIKVLRAFQDGKIALRHFAPTSGYGYDDVGRDALSGIFSSVFGAEKAIVSPLIASGTHALTLMLFGILRPGDVLLSASGDVYDTLQDVISKDGIGSLKDFGVKFHKVDLKGGRFDYESVKKSMTELNPKVVFIQRSRGYSWRNAFSVEDIAKMNDFVKSIRRDVIVAVDNCYGEFVSDKEPTEVGCDVCAGSLIKNPGGGLAPTGGYIAGKSELIEAIGYRLTSPGVGMEVGSYAADYRLYFQGVFVAPHVTAQALKGALLFAAVFSELGYDTLPNMSDEVLNDIICSVKFKTKDELIDFCRTVQSVSPVDSHVVPYPWDMPGYNHQVIMAAGTFVQGASIELSADSPIKEPYIAYLQGGLTYEHVRFAVLKCAEAIVKN